MAAAVRCFFGGYKLSMANLQTEMSSSAPARTQGSPSPTDGSDTLNPSPGCPSQYLTPLPAATQQLPVLWSFPRWCAGDLAAN